MLISKFSLYKAGWLDLVFENRNKEYGAYELRLNNGRNTLRAMGITFLGVAVLCAASVILNHPQAMVHVTPVDVTPPVLPIEVQKVKKIDPPVVAKLKPQPPAQKITTMKFVPPVVTVDNKVTEQPPVIDKLEGAIGTETKKGTDPGTSVIPDKKTGDGPGIAPEPDNTVHNAGTLDVMPEPVGGEKAWANFLGKNLRYPGEAQDQGVSGRVFLSFIIEKDGHLSNITVNEKAGYGFDEEALRVLKLAKAWKPGIQNGQPVRVRYTIPINFQLSEQ